MRPGDRIALMLQNVPQFPIAVHAAWLCGLVVTPVNPMNKPRELDYQLCDAGVRAVVCLDGALVAEHTADGWRCLSIAIAP